MMAVAHSLLRLNRADRPLRLFDTFDGMPPPERRIAICTYAVGPTVPYR
jgi:hypothetical protein